ncbi:MAG: acetate uptake transporter [Alkalibacterium sp.]|uniref:acetate uptake transporter n=1 Tax=Alkalibacterium sp. TaxID=1872447 RepID=UPI0039707723
MEKEQIVSIKEITANPAPLGLIAFGMTTVLLNIHNAGFIGLDAMILAMGIFFGGMAQVIAGIMEFKKNNTFGTTAFTSYGFFWLSLVGLNILPLMGIGEAPNALSMAAFLFMWGLFTMFMFVGTLRINKALQVVFGSLTILFFLLAIGKFTGSALILVIAGYEGIFCGLSAMYAAMAQVLNEVYGKTLLPIGEYSPLKSSTREKTNNEEIVYNKA